MMFWLGCGILTILVYVWNFHRDFIEGIRWTHIILIVVFIVLGPLTAIYLGGCKLLDKYYGGC